MKMRKARRAILSVLGALAMVFAFTYQAAAQDRPDTVSRAQLSVMAGGPPAAYQPAALPSALPRAVLLYSVRHGDTLSKVAAARCGKTDWTGIYAASRAARHIGADPNLIYPGQLLVISCRHVAILTSVVTRAGPRVTGFRHSSGGRTWDVSYGDPNYCGDGDHDGWDVSCGHGSQAYSHSSSRAYSRPAGGTYHGSGSMQQCIIARESGGSSQIMNSSGHYGLYQFSASTWAASGGNPADFGHASVAEQNQAFYNAVAARGYSDWARYDGC
jgi:hypothetical protein